MSRICVFVFYDFQGIVDDYVLYLMDSIVPMVNKLIVIVNGNIVSIDLEKLVRHSDIVYKRDNKGYDWGAYKDFFLRFADSNELNQYDELILMNNSFFGPLFPWDGMFDVMKESRADFWGISSAKEQMDISGEVMCSHLQGYFIVLRNTIITNDDFMKFWKSMEYPRTFRDAVFNGEVMFSKSLIDAGFKYDSYIDVVSGREYIDNKINYKDSADIFIINYKCPILKKKAVNPLYYKSFSNALDYIKNSTDYNVELIYKHIQRLDRYEEVKPYSFKNIKDFCKCHKSIYLYGAGEYAKRLENYISSIGVVVKGNLVTYISDGNNKDRIIELNDYSYDDGDGVIISVGRRYADEVYGNLIRKVKEEDILMPAFGKW